MINAGVDWAVMQVKEAKETVDKVNAAVAGYKSDLQGIKALSTQEIVSVSHTCSL